MNDRMRSPGAALRAVWRPRARPSLLLLLTLLSCPAAAEVAPADATAAVAGEPAPADSSSASDAPAAPAPAADDDASTATALPEVVVTANKQSQVLRDIPASIAALGGEQLDRAGAQGIDDFLKLVPGVNIIPNEPGAVKVTIRGISSELGTNATTGTLYGNLSLNDGYFPFLSLDPHPFDMNDVEVLKGPQGTLYGASALNGAVRYVPNRPQFDATSLRYFAQYTRLSEGGGGATYGAALNAPLGADRDAAVRLVAFDRRSPGYVDDIGRGVEDVNEIDQSGVRGLFDWQALDRGSIALMVVHQNTDFADEPFADNREGRLSRANTPQASPKHQVFDIAEVSLQYRFDAATLALDSGYVRKRFNESPDISRLGTGEAPAAAVDSEIFFDSDTWSEELRLSSPEGDDSPWSWVGGVFWMDQPIDSGFDIFTAPGLPAGSTVTVPDFSTLAPGAPLGERVITTDGQPIVGRQRADVTVRELALFADVTRRFGDWEASLGLRGYRTRSGGRTRASGAFYGGVENLNEGEVRETGLNPKVSLRWAPDSPWQVYALVSRGFRVGGIQPTASSLSTSIPRAFKSDTIWNYEAGVRTQWLDDTLRVDLTGFHEDWDEPQLAQRDPNNPNPVATYYDNVGGARSDGLEAALQWRTPLDGLSVSLAAAYVRTLTTEPFRTGAGVATQPGTTWPYAPRWQSATSLSYRRPLLRGFDLQAGATHTFISKAYTTLVNDIPVFDYQLLDLQLALVDATATWPELTLNLANALDERGINQHAKTGPANDVIYVRPRALILQVGGRF